MMVYSSSSFVASRDFKSSTHFLFRQFVFAVGGFVVMLVASKIRYQIYKKFTEIFIYGMVIVLLLVFVIGTTTNGSARWIYIGGIGFQPSEIAKLVIILFMAHVCTANPDSMNSIQGIAKAFWPVGLLIMIIAIENLSTAIICAAIAVGIWFVATPKVRYMGIVVLAGCVFVPLMIKLQSYRSGRIDAWLHPETSQHGYQTMQGLYAIGSGGLFGRGLGQSIQKMGFIPEAQNDMIFSIICEELGIVGAAGLIIVFLMLIWRFRFIAEGAPDRYGSLIVVGVITHVATQVLVNMCVVTNIIPNTGVTLPFISYGGTSLFFLLIEMGVVLSVSRQIEPLSLLEEEEGKEYG
ncbi:MAG: cell division protein FtsW [Eubacterium sp.]|nr:cell division protein FtsW [Eubacterium sp.]